MNRLRLVLPLAACLAVVACSRTRPPISAADDHFRVIVDYEDDRLPAPALAAVTPVWNRVAHLWGVPATPPAAPLDVHLYVDPRGYYEASARLTDGATLRNHAFAHGATMTAHVRLQPSVDPALIPPRGLPPFTERLLAHEAAHVARYAQSSRQEWRPLWAIHGSAMQVAAEVMWERGRDGPIDQAPFTSTLIAVAQRMQADGRCPSLSEILADRLPPESGDSHARLEPYALRWSAWRFLSTTSEAALRELMRTSPSAIADDRGRDTAFRTWLRDSRPRWLEERRGLATGKDGWQQCAFEFDSALAWYLGSAPPQYTLTGSISFVTGDGPEDGTTADVRFASRAGSQALVRFWPLPGGERTRVSIRDDVNGEELEHVLTDTREYLPFHIDVARDRVTVTIADEAPFHAIVGGVLDGPWGLAVSPGGWVKWHDFTYRY